MGYITESEKKVNVIGDYDVAVAGGGVAGIAAALASARQGKKTVLIEKQFALGGLGTLGLITIYLPLCDGCGNQVSFGIAEELLKLSVKHGYEEQFFEERNYTDECFKTWLETGKNESGSNQRYQVRYNANVFAILCEQLLIENGVEILYGTSVCDVIMNNDKISHLLIENKSGRSALAVKSVVDSTGDADVVKMSGEKTVLFSQGNILAAWYYFLNKDEVDLKMLGFSDIPDKYKTEEQKKVPSKRYMGVTGEELSEMTIDAHRYLLDNFLKDGGINKNHHLSTIATIPQIRMTRRIDGKYTLDDTEMHKHFDDSIGKCSDWRKSGPVYEIPFSTLHGTTVKNIITAGRCISVTDAMWDITRVIPVCAVTGEAAGTAAAMCDDFDNIDIKLLQQKLTENGVRI